MLSNPLLLLALTTLCVYLRRVAAPREQKRRSPR
jgi:hypothetical protein